MPCGGKRRRRNRIRVDLSRTLRVVSTERHWNGVRDLDAKVGTIDKMHRYDLVARQVGKRVNGKRNGVVLAIRRLRERAPVGEVVLHAVERTGVRTVWNGIGQIVRRKRSRRLHYVAHGRGGRRNHDFVNDRVRNRGRRDDVAGAVRFGGRLHNPLKRMRRRRRRSRNCDVGTNRDVCPVQHKRDGCRGAWRAGRPEIDIRCARRQFNLRRPGNRNGAGPGRNLRNLRRGERTGEDLRTNLDACENCGRLSRRNSFRTRDGISRVDDSNAIKENRIT